MLKKGGVLVYSTCTITPQENEEQVAWALKSFPCLRLEKQVSSLLYHCLLDRVSCLSVLKTKKKNPSGKDKRQVRDDLHSKVNDDFNFRNLSVDVLFFMKTFVSLSFFLSLFLFFFFLSGWLENYVPLTTLHFSQSHSLLSFPLRYLLFYSYVAVSQSVINVNN